MHERTRRQRSRGMVAVIAVIGLATAVTGCSGWSGEQSDAQAEHAQAPATPVRGGRLVYALEGDPNGLDPTRNAWDANGIQLANALYDPLIAVDADGQYQPYLAKALTASADYRSWVVTLRPNVSFSNGDPLDAPAAVAFYQALRTSAITGPPTKMMADVAVVDPLTFRITTSRPWAALPAFLSGQGGYVASPKQVVDDKGTEDPIGTGPFVLKRWQENRRFELSRNPHYWRAGLPYLDALDFEIVPEGADRIDQLVRGDIDVTSISAAWDVRRLDEVMANPTIAARLAVERDTSDSEKDFVMFNMSKPPLDDVRVRQAVAYATDIPALARSAGWPLDRLAQGPLSPGTPFFSPEPYPTYQPDKARELLRAYLGDTRLRTRPREVAFTFRVTDIDRVLGQQLVEQWRKVGINASLDLQDPKQMPRFAVMGDFGAMALRYFSAVDPDVLWHFFVSETIVDDGLSLNFARIKDADITAGMNEGRATTDPSARRTAYAKVQKAFARAMPILWLARTEWRVARRTGVRDAHSMTLPDGHKALPLLGGTHRLTEAWIEH